MTVVVDIADMLARIQLLEAEVSVIKTSLVRQSTLLLEVQADMRRGFAAVSERLLEVAEVLEILRRKAVGGER